MAKVNKDDMLPEGVEIAEPGSDYPAKEAAHKILMMLEGKYKAKVEWKDEEEATVKIGDESVISVIAYVDHDVEVRILWNNDNPSKNKLLQNVFSKDVGGVADEMFKWIVNMLETAK